MAQLSKELFDIRVNGKADIVEAEGETKVDIEDDLKIVLQCKIITRLEENAKVK